MTQACHNCLEALSYDGPRGNGDSTLAALLKADSRVFGFCSAACCDWWWSVSGSEMFDSRSVRVAEVNL